MSQPEFTKEELIAIYEALRYYLAMWPNEETNKDMKSAKEKLGKVNIANM
jgi:hypothetical protein